jgi:hypothetical protein
MKLAVIIFGVLMSAVLASILVEAGLLFALLHFITKFW